MRTYHPTRHTIVETPPPRRTKATAKPPTPDTHTCPRCRREGFTKAGLTRHKCVRTCAHCGSNIEGRRPQATTCGLACRVAMHRLAAQGDT